MIADRDTLLEISDKCKSLYGSVKVLAMNPNYLFFLFKNAEKRINHETVIECVAANEKTACLTKPLCDDIISHTPEFAAEPRLLGWYDIEKFIELTAIVECV